MADPVRVSKALADAGVASRRGADALIAAGRVAVNGEPAVTGQKVDPALDQITLDGRPLRARPEAAYLLLHKPAGVTSTVADRHAQETVLDLVPRDIRTAAARLYPVGRLDRDSEGLLLLTNDGDWAQRVLHPRHGVEREYAIGLGAELRPDQADRLVEGIELEEGLATMSALRRATGVEVARMEALAGRSAEPLAWYRAVLTQGWRRQLRRMFAAADAPVQRLIRVRLGTLRLDGLRSGELRPLTAAERRQLSSSAAPTHRDRAVGRPSDEAAPATRRRVTVSLDGPGSSGKSSVGAAAAAAVGYRFCDTGVLYRGLAWLAHHRRVDPADSAGLVQLVGELQLVPDEAGRLARLVVDGRDVTGRLHSAAVDRLVSTVAADAAARAALLPVQRSLADGGGIVMAGRDIGSVVLPDADLRLFLDVSLEERAERRARQRGLDPASAEAESIRVDLARRDGIDSGRKAAPLRIPHGAVVIRGDGLELDQTVSEVVKAIRAAERRAGREPRPS